MVLPANNISEEGKNTLLKYVINNLTDFVKASVKI